MENTPSLSGCLGIRRRHLRDRRPRADPGVRSLAVVVRVHRGGLPWSRKVRSRSPPVSVRAHERHRVPSAMRPVRGNHTKPERRTDRSVPNFLAKRRFWWPSSSENRMVVSDRQAMAATNHENIRCSSFHFWTYCAWLWRLLNISHFCSQDHFEKARRR